MIPDSNAPQTVQEAQDWNVRANTFSFSFGCVAAVSIIHVSSVTPDPVVTEGPISARPTQLQHSMTSELTVTITLDEDPTHVLPLASSNKSMACLMPFGEAVSSYLVIAPPQLQYL
jgi:hypothetical protein